MPNRTGPGDEYGVLRDFAPGEGRTGRLYSLPALAERYPEIVRLPRSIRVLLESVLRNLDGETVTRQHAETLIGWRPNDERTEVPLTVARVVLQDFTGTPLVCDLAAMRTAVERLGKRPEIIEPVVPVQLVIDHSVQLNVTGSPDALARNMELEYQRNHERYAFFKWGTEAFRTLTVVPPGVGIVHQVNLESLAKGVFEKDGIWYPDTLVGTDSHTTMINGIGVLGWGVGGIEAESAMLGEPVWLLAPDVVGVQLSGRLHGSATITDAVLAVTEQLRARGVVGKFVEFFGEGVDTLTAPDRATIANMAPEYGATLGYFPVDQRTIEYFRVTGRSESDCAALEAYYRAQDMFGAPRAGDIDYSAVVDIDLGTIVPSVAGPRRPQDRIPLTAVAASFDAAYGAPVSAGGYERRSDIAELFPLTSAAPNGPRDLSHGDILIAAITSCTNTSNPDVLIAAGLLARNALDRGLSVAPWIKTSFAPGSRAVTEYLSAAGLLEPMTQLGFGVAAYGCGVCAGNSGPLEPEIDRVVTSNNLVCAAVLSGNRNFEARIHPSLRANYLMTPALVIAFAIAGNMRTDITREALGIGSDGTPVTLADIWPTAEEVIRMRRFADDGESFRQAYARTADGDAHWNGVVTPRGQTYSWPTSTYISKPPILDDFTEEVVPPALPTGARILAILGNSITTDHISPAGAIKPSSPAGLWLSQRQVTPDQFNTYGARRGQHEVMVRGTFANVRLRNLMVPGTEGGVTRIAPSSDVIPIFDAAEQYRVTNTPLVIFAGEEYGTGSSRDWAAKGTQLLGVRAVIARSFERIHRSNLIGMGVLPCQFIGDESAGSLGLDGSETIDLASMAIDADGAIAPRSEASLTIRHPDGRITRTRLLVRLDTSMESQYFRHGGVPKYVL